MDTIRLYRRRYIPDEIIELKKDEILSCNEEYLVTRWNVLKPRKDIDHGISVYYIHKGFKISKVFDKENQLVYWYCDIIEAQIDKDARNYTFIDLLIDVLIYPDGSIKVVDLDEFADVTEAGTLPNGILSKALRQTDNLLRAIYNHQFETLVAPIEAISER